MLNANPVIFSLLKKVEWNNCIFLFYMYLCLSLIKNLT